MPLCNARRSAVRRGYNMMDGQARAGYVDEKPDTFAPVPVKYDGVLEILEGVLFDIAEILQLSEVE